MLLCTYENSFKRATALAVDLYLPLLLVELQHGMCKVQMSKFFEKKKSSNSQSSIRVKGKNWDFFLHQINIRPKLKRRSEFFYDPSLIVSGSEI